MSDVWQRATDLSTYLSGNGFLEIKWSQPKEWPPCKILYYTFKFEVQNIKNFFKITLIRNITGNKGLGGYEVSVVCLSMLY